MEPQLGDVSDDGYWVLTESGWQATEQQKQALEQGAIPYESSTDQSSENSSYDKSLVAIESSPISSNTGTFSDQNKIYSIILISVFCIGLLFQIIGMHLDSWTVNPEIDDEDAEFMKGSDGGSGLTDMYTDCSDVTGVDSESGETNKDMCKLVAGFWFGEISVAELNSAESVTELTDDLPDEMSAPISDFCKSVEDFEPEEVDLETCNDRASAGEVTYVLFWISFLAGLVAVILGVLGLIGKIPDYQIVEKYSMMGCALFSLIAFVYWLLMAPVFDSDSVVFGSGYYLTMFSILLLVSASIFSFINSSKPTKTFVF